MVMHVCSVAQEIAENCCEGNHQEQRGSRGRRETHCVTREAPKAKH